MKPTKNRFFCEAAQRIKMLFETESQANNFIKFNAKAIEELAGKSPVRCYYCNLCMGWHVTSNPNVEFFENYKSRAEIRIEKYEEEKKMQAASKEEAVFLKASALINEGEYEEACTTLLAAFHQYKSSPESADVAEHMLKDAFEAECLLVNSILDSGLQDYAHACKPAKRCLKLLKRAVSSRVGNYSNYICTLSPIVDNFPDEGAPVKQVVPPTEEELARREEQKLAQKEKQLEKMYKNVEKTLGIIYANLVSRPHTESLRLINKCAADIKKLSEYPQYKEGLIGALEKLMEYRRMYDEMFGN